MGPWEVLQQGGVGENTHFFLPASSDLLSKLAQFDPINGPRQGAWEEALQRLHLRTQSVDQEEQG